MFDIDEMKNISTDSFRIDVKHKNELRRNLIFKLVLDIIRCGSTVLMPNSNFTVILSH